MSCVKIENPFPLCKQPDVVVGVTNHADSENVIVTVQNTAVHVYNVVDQKCISSWNIGPSHTLSVPAIQHPVSLQFFAVDNSKSLCCWEKLSDKIESNAMQQFKHPIFALHVHSEVQGALVITSDGRLTIADPTAPKANYQSKLPNLSGSKHLVYSVVGQLTKKSPVCVMAIFEVGSVYSLHLYEIDETKKIKLSEMVILDTNDEDILSAAVDFKSNRIIWISSTGKLNVFDLKIEFSAQKTLPSIELSSFLEIQIDIYDYENTSVTSTPRKTKQKTNTSLALYAFDGSYLALLGLTKKKEYLMSVFEITYGTLLEQTIINTEVSSALRSSTSKTSTSTSSSNLNTIQLMRTNWLDGSYFISTTNQNVDICPIYARPFSLAGVLGGMNKILQSDPNKLSNGVEMVPPLTRTLDSLQSNMDVSSWLSLGKDRNDEEQKIIASLKKSKTEKTFLSHFEPYVATCTTQTNKSKNAVDLSYHFVSQIVDFCISDKGLFVPDALSTIIESGCCSAQANPELCNFLLEKKELGLIEKYFLHVPDITESQVISVIKYVLDDSKKSILDKFMDEWPEKRKKRMQQNDTCSDTFLSLILSAPRNDVFMLAALKSLSTIQVVSMLDFIRKWIYRYTNVKETAIQRSAALRVPSYAQVLDWLALILDAHLTRLVLASDVYAFIVDITTMIREQTDMCEKIQDLKGYMVQFESKIQPVINEIPVYSIEIIDF